MPKGHPLDLDVVHRALWANADRRGQIRINQGQLAKTINITKFTMSRVMAKLIDQKRIRRVSGGRHNEGLFVIEEPDAWNADNPPEEEW